MGCPYRHGQEGVTCFSQAQGASVGSTPGHCSRQLGWKVSSGLEGPVPSPAGVTQLLSLSSCCGAAVHGMAGKSNSAAAVQVKQHFLKGRVTKGPCAHCHQSYCTLGTCSLCFSGSTSGRHTTTWLAEGKSSILMLFPAAGGMFGAIKNGCGRVESNLQSTLDLAALRCSCLHAGGTTACSVARLEREQE